MEKLNFLPLWEMERVIKKKRSNLYLLMYVLIFLNSLFVIITIFNMKDIQSIKVLNSQRAVLIDKNYNDMKIKSEKKIDSLKSYQWYNKEISNEIISNTLFIKNKEIIIQAKAKDYSDYISIISSIENKCKVKDISVAKLDENYLEFSLTLEANYE